jgi:membrane-associated HD superfamily phosphohydrolase
MFDIISPILFILILAGLAVLIYFVVILYKSDQQQNVDLTNVSSKYIGINTDILNIKNVDLDQNTSLKNISTDLMNKSSAITSLQSRTETNTSSITSLQNSQTDLSKNQNELTQSTSALVDLINIQSTSFDKLNSDYVTQGDMLKTQQDLLNTQTTELNAVNKTLVNYDNAFTYDGSSFNLKTPVSFTGPQAIFNGSTLSITDATGKVTTSFNNKALGTPTNMITGDTSMKAINSVTIDAPVIKFNGVVSVCDTAGTNCKNI